MRTLRGQLTIGRIGSGDRMMKIKPHDEAMAEMYCDDPALALGVINDILADGDQAELSIVLRQMALAFGGVQAVAKQAHLNPTQLYRTLLPKGNPALSSLSAILKARGMRLAMQPLPIPAQAAGCLHCRTLCRRRRHAAIDPWNKPSAAPPGSFAHLLHLELLSSLIARRSVRFSMWRPAFLRRRGASSAPTTPGWCNCAWRSVAT